MIIDGLTHLHADPRAFGEKYDLSPQFLIENLERSPIDKAVVTAIEGNTRYCTPTSFVIECCERYPDRLIGFASVNPLTNPRATEDLKRFVEERGMRGLKLHPRHQGFGADNPAIVPVVRLAAELGIPVYICGSQWRNAPLRNQLPQNIDVLCKAVPEAKIVIAHSGGFYFWDAFVVAIANPNVYFETSIALRYFEGTPFEDQYLFTLKQLGACRVIFGSDHPEEPSGQCYTRSRSLLERHGFTNDELEHIFGGTLLSLLPT
jgi:hypothetical protein